MTDDNTTTAYQYPNAIVETDWLASHLQDSQLRIFDCTTYLRPADATTQAPYRIETGYADYCQAHIPGAGFIDLQQQLSDNDTSLRFMLPSAEHFAQAMSQSGVGEDHQVILYSAGSPIWATRVWWMLRVFGFDNAAILNGGWEKWHAENRPVSDEPCQYPPAQFVARPRTGLVVGKETVLNHLDQTDTVIINALNAQLHAGLEPSRYGRPGRIPNSVNVPAASLLDDSGCLVSANNAQQTFNEIGADRSKNVIAYCGGGIAATLDLFLLHQLGYQQLSLYDASMGEWAQDAALPIETD